METWKFINDDDNGYYSHVFRVNLSPILDTSACCLSVFANSAEEALSLALAYCEKNGMNGCYSEVEDITNDYGDDWEAAEMDGYMYVDPTLDDPGGWPAFVDFSRAYLAEVV